MNPASSEQRNSHAAAISGGVLTRRTGTRTASTSRGGTPPRSAPARDMGVSTIDGGMVLAVMPCGDSSLARDLVSEITPPLEATYAARSGAPDCALEDEMVTIRPH